MIQNFQAKSKLQHYSTLKRNVFDVIWSFTSFAVFDSFQKLRSLRWIEGEADELAVMICYTSHCSTMFCFQLFSQLILEDATCRIMSLQRSNNKIINVMLYTMKQHLMFNKCWPETLILYQIKKREWHVHYVHVLYCSESVQMQTKCTVTRIFMEVLVTTAFAQTSCSYAQCDRAAEYMRSSPRSDGRWPPILCQVTCEHLRRWNPCRTLLGDKKTNKNLLSHHSFVHCWLIIVRWCWWYGRTWWKKLAVIILPWWQNEIFKSSRESRDLYL